MTKPLLSIGIIFKNEIRCLERCLKALQPLRDIMPCEVVMADTGSDDGSREIAEKYADILFDFPWINDFAAARNAVMDHCSGEWYFSIDADEWLDGEITELKYFVQDSKKFPGNIAILSIYNYGDAELEEYSEFRAVRLIRLSTGLRYKGAIHERVFYEEAGRLERFQLTRVFLHHDGYVQLYEGKGKAKRDRNVKLLREELKKDPDNLVRLTQYVESGGLEPDYIDQLKRGMELVRKKSPSWEMMGPPLFRLAILAANANRLPETDEWIKEANELFPDSLFIRVDVEFIHFSRIWDEHDYAKSIAIGEPCYQTMVDLRENRISKHDLACGALVTKGHNSEQELAIFLAEAYRQEKQFEKCVEYLMHTESRYMNEMQVKRLTRILINLHTQTTIDTAPLVTAAWDDIQEPLPDEKRAQMRRGAFLQEASTEFRGDREEGERPAYTLFLPLADRCEVGRAARILELTDVPALEEILIQVEHWNELPITALEHALLSGVRFPLVNKPLKLEDMEALAARMCRKDGPLADLAIQAAKDLSGWQNLTWAEGLALAAVRTCDWTDSTRGVELCRVFAEIENIFLPRYYCAELLCDENIQALPLMHRFGWYCGKAFGKLDAGDSTGYVQLLRKGLETCPEMKALVEFLLKQLEEQEVQATPELLNLAEQVRTILAQYPADDPAVVMLKQSEAYRQVAHLIEGPELGIYGALKQ